MAVIIEAPYIDIYAIAIIRSLLRAVLVHFGPEASLTTVGPHIIRWGQSAVGGQDEETPAQAHPHSL